MVYDQFTRLLFKAAKREDRGHNPHTVLSKLWRRIQVERCGCLPSLSICYVYLLVLLTAGFFLFHIVPSFLPPTFDDSAQRVDDASQKKKFC